ncbi:TonB-dependent receptor [Alkalitalea saponilacus]|uniref:Outer membrane receptor proteins, mostly Fe transport n=1 Tax=Alkalitalea saponilacus TaxID=889453 RepID=A0A1T5HSH8_9BACT|nr:TonB-dependent receptor plug domain-containing protein [Alkalitalea saponilacus]SKC23481.1 Outer membrane receptor proteins, mostly Fe transport [Alkalitalea saponilacus]
MGNRTLLICFCILVFGSASATKAQSLLTGRVVDESTGEVLSGAIVSRDNLFVTKTDENGFFEMRLPEDSSSTLAVSFVGFETYFILSDQIKGYVEIFLVPLAVEMDEITITHSADSRFIRDSRTGVIEFSTKESQFLPQFLGQTDLFKTLELLPGFQTGGEGDAAIYIRGGSFDQNLILLDGAPVYNPSHLLGFYSVFNPDIVNSVELIKSGIPVEYGNRLSSVIISSTDRNVTPGLSVGGNVGVLSTAINAEMPVVENQLSVYGGFRRTHINMILSLMDEFDMISSRSVEFESGYDFYDVNGGINYAPNRNHNLSLSFYKGRDLFSMHTPAILLDADMNWGNEIVALNWNHRIGRNLSAVHTFFYSDYDFEIELRNPAYDLLMHSGVNAMGHKSKFVYTTDFLSLYAGVDNKYQRFIPNSSQAGTETVEFDFGTVDRHYLGEYSFFAGFESELTARWMLTAGLRINRAVQYGPYRKFSYNDTGVISDTTFIARGEVARRFTRPDYMVALRYLISSGSSIKLSFNRNHQFTHMVNATTVSFPVDFWVASGIDIPVQSGWQLAGGWYTLSANRMFQFSVEAYYKEAKNHSEFDNYFMQSVDNTPLVESLVYGRGKMWGAEFLVSKQMGDWQGWIGYTISKSIASIKEIEDGRWFPTAYDRPHDFSLVVSYDHNEKWKFGGTFVYSTGRPYTPSIGRYFLENNVVSIYGARNSDRFPDYHRLDLSATRVLKDTGKRYSALVFSIYNAYSRSNPFFIFPKVTGDLSEYNMGVEPYKVSIFPVLPSVSWQFRF